MPELTVPGTTPHHGEELQRILAYSVYKGLGIHTQHKGLVEIAELGKISHISIGPYRMGKYRSFLPSTTRSFCRHP